MVYIANGNSKSTKKGENVNPGHTDNNSYVKGELVSYVS